MLGTPADAWSTLAVLRLLEAAVAPISPLGCTAQYLPPGTNAARSWMGARQTGPSPRPGEKKRKWRPRLSRRFQVSSGRIPRPLNLHQSRRCETGLLGANPVSASGNPVPGGLVHRYDPRPSEEEEILQASPLRDTPF
ncbi:hypothetical protein NDU88_002408 [Pleurodeles waltl]|uniref:Uncharacterized protein n=1 Tax=Pleurodeles waltl TaxID=8319 RepID=A0AAV7WPH1_PLEWA|nr:hypothetical protein NDU88_002408 [Pleurodeles waltl]